MRSVLLGATMMLLLAGCAPGDIATASCTNAMLSTADEWSCTITGDPVGRVSSLEFDTESRNQIAQVSIRLQVTSGTLRVGYADLSGPQHLLVTPSEPADLRMRTRMHRDRRSFTLMFEPVNGPVQGLSGTVKYSTP